MSSMCVRAALAVLLLFIATVDAGEGGVTFWRKNFTMTCPEYGGWFFKEKDTTFKETAYTVTYNEITKGLYFCKYNEKKYYFYVKGKVCENCFEVDATLFGLAIAVDVIGTAIVMIIIYRCTKKKSSAVPTQTSKGVPAPPVPNPDYEPLNQHTRSQDPYSTVNRMG
ncbi:hypothetical protein PBY51_009473 [Eleginops maclovinus]|uniref:CD3 gamma/delta subunit Ig-like domain-containing protein n=1 Tax=Eleginops maclovinus TaxID=56733 RepID=A0AAN7XU52_ELEMC|nr:hypothetical protein PBY51_009473 [Eleginops maclovinus]